MTSQVTHAPKLIRAYLQQGEEGLAEIEEQIESEAHERPNGKFSKKRALYLPQAPFLPTIWRTSCGRCRFWEEGEPGESGHCHIVGREDDPFGGEAIHYRGWCGFWMPPEGEPAFAWINERLRPDGTSSVRGEFDPEMTAKGRRRAVRASIPTEPDARQDAIRSEMEETDDK